MRGSLGALWSLLFVALVQLPVAAVVGVIIGQTDLSIWVMGIAAHQAVRSATDQSFLRRLAIWLIAMAVGGITAVLAAVAIGLVTQNTAGYAMAGSGEVTSAFWLIVASRLAIRWAPAAVAWAVSRNLVRRSARPGQVLSPVAVTRQHL